MTANRLTVELFALDSVAFIQEMLRPAYKIYEFNEEDSEPPAITCLDICLEHSNARKLTAAFNKMAERPSYKVVNINCSGYYIIQVEGAKDFIHELASTVESFGAERIAS